MEKIITKLENMIAKYLDEIETKPVKTLILTFILYYFFKTANDKKG